MQSCAISSYAAMRAGCYYRLIKYIKKTNKRAIEKFYENIIQKFIFRIKH